jgi:hypothetical protein
VSATPPQFSSACSVTSHISLTSQYHGQAEGRRLLCPADRPVQRVTDRHTGVLSLPHVSCLAQPWLEPGSKPRGTATKRGHGLPRYPRYSPRLLRFVISLFSEQTKCRLHLRQCCHLVVLRSTNVSNSVFFQSPLATHTDSTPSQ